MAATSGFFGGELQPGMLLRMLMSLSCPLYDRFVVKRVEDKDAARQGGRYVPGSAKEPQQGRVVAICKGKRFEEGKVVALNVQLGDRVLFGEHSGSVIKLDGQQYTIMREDEILGILKQKYLASDEGELMV